MYQRLVHLVKRHLTRSVDEVGEADEDLDLIHVQDKHGSHGGHTLHLGVTDKRGSGVAHRPKWNVSQHQTLPVTLDESQSLETSSASGTTVGGRDSHIQRQVCSSCTLPAGVSAGRGRAHPTK